MELLDGTFSGGKLQIGTNSDQTMDVVIRSTSATTLTLGGSATAAAATARTASGTTIEAAAAQP